MSHLISSPNEFTIPRTKRITLAVARARGLRTYFTGVPCKRGHIAERQTANAVCIPCEQARQRGVKARAYAANPEKFRERKREEHAANPERRHARDRKAYAEGRTWSQRHPEQASENNRKRYQKNVERALELGRRWRQENPAAFAATASLANSRRRCRVLGLPDPLPEGYDRALLLPLFRRLVLLRNRYPERKYELDHIIGLQFGGMHCLENLQILSKAKHAVKTAREKRTMAILRSPKYLPARFQVARKAAA